MPYTEFQIALGPARVIVRLTTLQGDLVRYAVILQTLEASGWANVRLWDNSDGPHHEHKYNRKGEKLPPKVLPYATPNHALQAALTDVKGGYERMVSEWRR